MAYQSTSEYHAVNALLVYLESQRSVVGPLVQSDEIRPLCFILAISAFQTSSCFQCLYDLADLFFC